MIYLLAVFIFVYLPMFCYTIGYFKEFKLLGFILALFWPIVIIIGAGIEANKKGSK